MAEQSAQERTEQPTEKRKKDARKKGQVARSRELNLLLSLLTASGGMLILGGTMVSGFVQSFRQGLQLSGAQSLDSTSMSVSLASMGLKSLMAFAPFLLLSFLTALLAPMLLGGLAFNLQSLQFKAEKINPLAGLKRIFSAQGLSELAKAILKVVLIGLAAWFSLQNLLPQLVSMGMWSTIQSSLHTLELLVWQILLLSVVLVPLVLFDVPFQLWNHNKQLKMTRQEIKDESKDSEGRPEVKSRIRALQQQAAQRSLVREVPQADVVITNPTHFAVALKYDREGSGAPVLVAKGTDELAGMIRQIAEKHQIRIFPMPGLARALYWNVREGAEIPPLLYVAVAKVLAWVYQVDAGMAGDPEMLPEIEIPEEYREDIER